MVRVGVKYVGKKPRPYTDAKLLNFGYVWPKPESVVTMPADQAAQFLKYPDAFQLVEGSVAGLELIGEELSVREESTLPKALVQDDSEASRILEAPPLVDLNVMGKVALVQYAQRHFNEKLHHKMSEENMREKIRSWTNSSMKS